MQLSKSWHKILVDIFKPFSQSCKSAESALAFEWSRPVELNLILVEERIDLCSEFSTAVGFSCRLYAREWSFGLRGCAPCPPSVEIFSKTSLQFLMKCVAKQVSERWIKRSRKEEAGDDIVIEFHVSNKKERDYLQRREVVCSWNLRCWREVVAAPSDGLPGDSVFISVLIRLILRICNNSLTADCGILNVFAQSKISCTVMSAELLNCVLLVSNSSNGSSFMFINSSTCWWSSLVRVMVIGTETTEVGVEAGGTSCVLLVIIMVSLALRFFKLMFCCLVIGVMVMSLFSISLSIYLAREKSVVT